MFIAVLKNIHIILDTAEEHLCLILFKCVFIPHEKVIHGRRFEHISKENSLHCTIKLGSNVVPGVKAGQHLPLYYSFIVRLGERLNGRQLD